MFDELHNWLLLMDLKTRYAHSRNRAIGLCLKKSQSRFSIPQAFPQVGEAF
jgi:hypothetical protein